MLNDDGCNSECLIEPKFTCTGGSLNTKDTWKAICGDGYRVGSEIWDDGNKVNGDGCSSSCLAESQFTCSGGSPSAKDVWSPIWGDGYRVGSEQWDDANKIKGDGCNSSCVIEAKFACKGGSSTTKDVWSPIWGDDYRIGSEQWDDGNTINGDGWSAINVIFRLVWIQHGSVFLDLLKYRSSQINLHFKSNASLFVDFVQFDLEVLLSDDSVVGRSSAVDCWNQVVR